MHLQLKCCKLSNVNMKCMQVISLKGNLKKQSSFMKTLKSCGTESLEKFTKGSLLRIEKYAGHRADLHLFLQSSPAAKPSPAQVVKQDSVIQWIFTLKGSKPSPRQTYVNCLYILNKYTLAVQSGRIDNHSHIISFDILILLSYK